MHELEVCVGRTGRLLKRDAEKRGELRRPINGACAAIPRPGADARDLQREAESCLETLARGALRGELLLEADDRLVGLGRW